MKKRFKDKRKSKRSYYRKRFNENYKWKSKRDYELIRYSFLSKQLYKKPTFTELEDIFYNAVKEVNLPNTYSNVFHNYPDYIMKLVPKTNSLININYSPYLNQEEDLIRLKKHIKQMNFIISQYAVDSINFDIKTFFKQAIKEHHYHIKENLNTNIHNYYIHFVILERYDYDLEIAASIIYYTENNIL